MACAILLSMRFLIGFSNALNVVAKSISHFRISLKLQSKKLVEKKAANTSSNRNKIGFS